MNGLNKKRTRNHKSNTKGDNEKKTITKRYMALSTKLTYTHPKLDKKKVVSHLPTQVEGGWETSLSAYI